MKKLKSKLIAPRSIRRMFPQVKTIIDAKHPVEVHVKSKDCDNAISLDSTNCALAQAVKREFKADAAIIGLSTSYIIKGTKAIRFESGNRIAREIVSFDRHHDFEPGQYKLVPKSKSVRLGIKRSGIKKNSTNHSAKRRIYGQKRVRLLTVKQ